MNDVYLYDGEFSSLLALILEIRKRNKIPSNIVEESIYQASLLEDTIYLDIPNKNENITQLRNALPKGVLGRVYYVYLSNDKNKEIIIYDFIKYALHYQNKVFYYRRIDSINEVLKISQRVGGEAHKLKGFVRFQEMKNHFLYSEISPTNQVLPILMKHFKNRFPNENFCIKDSSHKTYGIYMNKKVFYLREEDLLLDLEKKEKEESIEDLWKTFHKTIAIKERENRKCQQNFMPKRYWKNMLEMEDEV